jgi:hypothetical protein
MPVTRTIYTQGAVSAFGDLGGANTFGHNPKTDFFSGVQSVSFSVTSPKQDVNQQGVLGSINKVQLEPVAATAEITCVVTDQNIGFLPYLISGSKRPNPIYYDVILSGIGEVSNAVLASFSIEAGLGQLAQLTLRFEGQSGAPQTAGPVPNNPYTGTPINVVIPSDVTGILYSGGGSTCAQNIRLNWEMPVERLNCLGSAINNATIFTRPPGNTTLVINGLSAPTVVTGLTIGPHIFQLAQVKEISRTHNMAVGDAAASFNLTEEGNAFSLIAVYEFLPPDDLSALDVTTGVIATWNLSGANGTAGNPWVSGYKLYRATTATGVGTLIATLPSNSGGFSDPSGTGFGNLFWYSITSIGLTGQESTRNTYLASIGA